MEKITLFNTQSLRFKIYKEIFSIHKLKKLSTAHNPLTYIITSKRVYISIQMDLSSSNFHQTVTNDCLNNLQSINSAAQCKVLRTQGRMRFYKAKCALGASAAPASLHSERKCISVLKVRKIGRQVVQQQRRWESTFWYNKRGLSATNLLYTHTEVKYL